MGAPADAFVCHQAGAQLASLFLTAIQLKLASRVWYSLLLGKSRLPTNCSWPSAAIPDPELAES